MSDRPRVLVLFGGRSGEHSVSCLSARGVLWALDGEEFDVVSVGVRRDGRWRLMPHGVTATRQGTLPSVPDSGEVVTLVPATDGARLVGLSTEGIVDHGRIDVCFPVLHGPYGEDGTIQGFLASVGVPYVGCGVGASALAMDKRQTKHVLEREGLPIVSFRTVSAARWAAEADVVLAEVEHDIAYPVFTKPTSQGSSIGVSKCRDRDELREGIAAALEYGRYALVEHALGGIRELECGVLGDHGDLQVSLPGEAFHTGTDFYDFDAKYFSPVELQCPADLPGGVADRCREVAAAAYRALGCEGMARVDLFYAPQTDAVIVNEVNTMPLLTVDSMFPRVWEAEGVSFRALVHGLISSGLNSASTPEV